MTGWLFLIIAVTGSTLIWPVARWGLAGDSRPAVAGFYTSLAMAATSFVACAVRREWNSPPAPVWIAAALMAIAYAIGFWLLIMHALKIGPAGPTVTVNNMAMVCGVLYGVLYLRPRGTPNAFVLAGALGTCLALILIGMGRRTRTRDGAPVPRRWLPMVIAGGAFSGLSFMAQTYIGEVQRPFRFVFLMITSLGAALILLPIVLKRRATGREVISGVAVGGMSAIGLLLTLAAFEYLGSAIVLPFSVTTPVLLMLVIGHFVYREHLSRPQLAGSLIGALAVLMLALGSR